MLCSFAFPEHIFIHVLQRSDKLSADVFIYSLFAGIHLWNHLPLRLNPSSPVPSCVTGSGESDSGRRGPGGADRDRRRLPSALLARLTAPAAASAAAGGCRRVWAGPGAEGHTTAAAGRRRQLRPQSAPRWPVSGARRDGPGGVTGSNEGVQADTNRGPSVDHFLWRVPSRCISWNATLLFSSVTYWRLYIYSICCFIDEAM